MPRKRTGSPTSPFTAASLRITASKKMVSGPARTSSRNCGDKLTICGKSWDRMQISWQFLDQSPFWFSAPMISHSYHFYRNLAGLIPTLAEVNHNIYGIYRHLLSVQVFFLYARCLVDGIKVPQRIAEPSPCPKCFLDHPRPSWWASRIHAVWLHKSLENYPLVN